MAPEFLAEFLCWTGGADVLCTDICLVSNMEVQCGESVPICLNLVLGLHFGDLLMECCVKLFEVNNELVSPHGGGVVLRVYGQSGVVTLVGE